jgi:hypothetical protein
MALINETIDNFDVWLVRLKLAAYMSIILFICIIFSYFINFATWPLTMSSLTADWSAFGSLLAGAASFLGAIGTVGVMLLGIKQFKIQQKQIEAQNERQNIFENLQQEKWKHEDEMIKQQRFIEHQNQFLIYIKNFESYSKFKIDNKLGLYKKLFPNNNHENTYLVSSFDTNGSHLLERTKDTIEKLYLDSHSDGIEPVVLLWGTIESLKIFNFKYLAPPANGDILKNNYENSGINVFKLDDYFEDLKRMFETMVIFGNSNLKLIYKSPEKSCTSNLEKFAIENLTDLGFDAKIFTTCNGVKELIKLQIEAKELFEAGLPFEPIKISDDEYMRKMVKHWESIISFINEDEQIPNELEHKLSEFHSARFHNYAARQMYRKRS